MRKKTKWGVFGTSLFALVVGASAAAIGFGLVPFFAVTSAAGIGIIGTAVAAVGLVGTVSIIIEGAIKRSNAKKTQIKASQAEYELVKTNNKSKVKSMAKMKRRDLKLARSAIYLARNYHSGIYGMRYRLGTSATRAERLRQEAMVEREAWEMMNNFAQRHGSEYEINRSGRKIEALDKKIERLNRKIARRTGTVDSTINSPRYEEVYQMRAYEGMVDNRTLGGFNNKETRDRFVNYINSDKSVELRYGPSAKGDYGFVVEIGSRSGNMVPVYAGSNCEQEMELYELMLLEDIKLSIEKGDIEFQPLSVKKMHYKTDKNITGTAQYGITDRTNEIRSIEELDERIALLRKTIAPHSSIKKHNGYLNRRYEDTEATR